MAAAKARSADVVLIDTPPMVNIADARVIGQHADAVVLVVRSGVTSRDAALLVTVPAGAAYTIQVSGVNNGTGEALVEVYEVF